MSETPLQRVAMAGFCDGISARTFLRMSNRAQLKFAARHAIARRDLLEAWEAIYEWNIERRARRRLIRAWHWLQRTVVLFLVRRLPKCMGGF
jgi:hypothetical protein